MTTITEIQIENPIEPSVLAVPRNCVADGTIVVPLTRGEAEEFAISARAILPRVQETAPTIKIHPAGTKLSYDDKTLTEFLPEFRVVEMTGLTSNGVGAATKAYDETLGHDKLFNKPESKTASPPDLALIPTSPKTYASQPRETYTPPISPPAIITAKEDRREFGSKPAKNLNTKPAPQELKDNSDLEQIAADFRAHVLRSFTQTNAGQPPASKVEKLADVFVTNAMKALPKNQNLWDNQKILDAAVDFGAQAVVEYAQKYILPNEMGALFEFMTDEDADVFSVLARNRFIPGLF